MHSFFMQTSKVDPFAFSTPVLSATGKGTPWDWDVQTQCLSCCKQAGFCDGHGRLIARKMV